MGSSLTPYQRLLEFQDLTNPADPASSSAHRHESKGTGWFQYARRTLIRNWKPIAGLTLLGIALGLGFALVQTPVYRTKAVVEIQVPTEEIRQSAESVQVDPYLETQLRLLQSDGVLWTAAVKSGLLETPEYAGLSRAARLDTILSNVKVKPVGQTRILEVAFDATDPAAAASFANETVQAYRALMRGRQLASARQNLAALEAQLAERKEKADTAQARMQEFLRTHPSIDTAEARIREWKTALERAEAVTAQERQALQAQTDVREQARLRRRYESARRKEQQVREIFAWYNSQLGGQANHNPQYQALRLDFDQNRFAYNDTVQRYQEASTTANILPETLLVLDTAHEPELPVTPNKGLSTVAGLLSGLLAGLIIAFGREARTNQIETQAKASAMLGVPQLGVAPPAWIDAPKNEPKRLAPAESRGRYALWNFHNPGSAHAEAYRDIVTSLMFASELSHDGHLRVVVTSANSGEGRTTAAVNLATGIAETGCRVLLIDGNRGKQALHEIFEAPDATGFFQAIAIQDGLTAPVFASNVANLFVMPAGPYNNAMLDVGSLRKVLEDLRETYDVIIIDAPPVLGHADARWFARVSHGVVLVHDPGVSLASDAQAALDRLQNDRIHVFGTVLNQWSDSTRPRVKAVLPEIRIRLRITS